MAPEAGLEHAGSEALSVFVRGLNAKVLRAHADGPLNSAELEERLGWAAEASLRVATAELCELGVLERAGRQPIVTKLTPGGHELLGLADTLERWISHSPFGALDLDHAAARGTVKALVAGWESSIVRALAEHPCRLADLSREIAEYSYASLKRRFVKLRSSGLVVAVDGGARSPTYEATSFLRRAAAALALAARWEREHGPGAACVDGRDLIAVLLLTLPMVSLPTDSSGSCVLAVPAASAPGGGCDASPAALGLVVEKGQIVSFATAATAAPATWVLGPSDAFLEALLLGEPKGLRLRGPDTGLAASLFERLHRVLSE